MSVPLIRDALPVELAEQARALFLSAKFKRARFHDPAHFAKLWPTGGFGIPDHDDIYCTDFHSHDGMDEINAMIVSQIIPLVAQATGRKFTKMGNHYYKLFPGGHLRLHRDNASGGHTGFVWHLSKGWKWDWGGLMVAIDGETASATLPVFNTLVLLDHAAALPHLVTQVAPWAKEPRMMVTGILR